MRWLSAFAAVLLLSTATVSAAPEAREAWHLAAVNHVDTRYHVLVFTDRAGRVFVRHIDVTQLDLPLPGPPNHRHAAEWYYLADDLPEHEVYVDAISQRVHFVDRTRTHIDMPPSEDLLLDVTVNGRRLDEPLLLHFEHGEIDFSESALVALGINEQKARLLLREDDELPVHAIAGENFSLDYAALTLNMTVPPELFLPVEIGVAPRTHVAVEPAAGFSATLGYDITAGVDAAEERWNAGLFELAAGSGTRTCLTQHVRLPQANGFRRLDSRCIFDWPRKLLSLNVGDAVTHPGASGQAVRYGGIRFGTDYQLAPAFVTQPSLALLGSARVPSTLEVWVDQMLALRREVDPGVFDITDIPVHTGAGEVRAVITNALGVRETIHLPFYSDPALFAPGVADWAVELGRLREDYALPTDHYDDRFGLFNLRYGATDWLTIAPRIEYTDTFRVAALSSALRLGHFGVIELGRSESETAEGLRGGASAARFARRGRYISFSLSHETSEETFVQLGFPLPGDTPAEQTRASLGINLFAGISASFGGFRRLDHDDNEQRVHTASVNVSLGRQATLILTAFDPVEPVGEPMYAAHLVIPFGTRHHASANAFRQGDTRGAGMVLQRNSPAGPGFGYRLEASETEDSKVSAAELSAQGNAARLRLAARDTDLATTAQAQLTGSVLATGHGVALSRWVDGGAAMVALPAGGVRVYHDNRVAAVTGTNGLAVIPGLRPYEVNRLRVEIDDLPLGAEIAETELAIVPGRRQAVPADFAITQSRHLSGTLWQSGNGKPVPPGAAVRVNEGSETVTVGFDGFLYIPFTGMKDLHLEVRWPQGNCVADVDIDTATAFIDAGEIACR